MQCCAWSNAVRTFVRCANPGLELPDQLDTLNWDQVVAILDDERYQKKQLIELGEKRLGIPPSRLLRLKRADAISSIRAALDNERTLAAIGRHARLTGGAPSRLKGARTWAAALCPSKFRAIESLGNGDAVS